MDSILFIYAFLAISFIVLGYITRKKIWNLFAIPSFLAIAIEINSTPVLISMIGLILWQLYDIFFGDV